jgi:cytochrome c
MNYYYLNKVAMAVLLALLLFFGTRTLINIAYEEHAPETPGYEVAGAEEEPVQGDEKKGEEDKGAAFIVALNKADPAKGEQAAGLCKVCHSFEKGGPNMIGPDLYGVVGHKIAAHEGFSYSAALKDHGGEWTFENLNHWLENPAGFAPGTTMAFPGIKDLQKRADVIAYLNQNSDEPLPIPEPAAAPAADESAEAEESPDKAAPEILTLLAEADATKGEQDAALCKVCHSFEAGGPNMVGPNLHNVVGAELAKKEGFSYSQALKDKGGAWTYERLDAWLENPQAFAPGTTMAYPGIAEAKKRANVIAYLRSQTENPPELPAGDAAAAPAEEKAQSENADDPGMAGEDAAPAAEESKPADEAAPAEDEAAPAEEPATEESAEEAMEPTEEAAPPAEEAMEPTEEAAPPAEEAMEPAEEGAPAEDAAMPAEEPAASESSDADADTPAAAEDTASDSDTIVNSPMVSEDAPSLPHKGEPPSPNQPQPVVPSDPSSTTTQADEPSASDDSGSASDDSGSTSSQPQPVYPDGKPDGI